MRYMGGLRPHIKVTFLMMLIGTFAITGVGIPFTPVGFAGFFSKDVIIEATYASHSPASGFAFTLLVIAAVFTSFYSWRLIFLTFFGKPRASHEVMHHVHESPSVMLVPLYVLAIGAVVAGFVFEGMFYGEEYAEFWKGALFTSEHNELLHEFHHVPVWVALSPFVAMLIGLVTAWYFYIRSPETPKRLATSQQGLYQFLLNKWYFDELYDFLFVRSAKALGRFLWKKGDVAVIDNYGPNGVAARVVDVTNRVVKLQSGYLYHYAFAMLLGIAALVTWMMLGSSM
jgi:NADH-quinone oxidoreductase subunit L